MEYKAYCVKCKIKIVVDDPKIEEIKVRGAVKKAVKGTCHYCGTKVCVFIK
ncbi:hypothetical protein ES703_91828 [subsurface metagenome]